MTMHIKSRSPGAPQPGTSQPAGPFPPLPAPPLMPPTTPAAASQQSRPRGPDVVDLTPCKSNIASNQARVIVYDITSFVSLQSLMSAVACSCPANSEACLHTFRILHICTDKTPEWSIAQSSTFPVQFSNLSLQGHLAIMDGHNLYVPILQGATPYLENEGENSELRLAFVKTIANVLAIVASHQDANLSCLLLEPCYSSLCDLRFRDVVTIIDFARRQLPNSNLTMRLETRLPCPNRSQLSFCEDHPSAPRVCPNPLCFRQMANDAGPSSSLLANCSHCHRQFVSAQQAARPSCSTSALNVSPARPSCSAASPNEPETPNPDSPPPASYAGTLRVGLPLEKLQPTNVITKITVLERNVASHAENFRTLFDSQHALSSKVTHLENGNGAWQTYGKQCINHKKVQSNSQHLKRLEIDLASMQHQMKEFQHQMKEVQSSLFMLTRQLSNPAPKAPLPPKESIPTPQTPSSSTLPADSSPSCSNTPPTPPSSSSTESSEQSTLTVT